MIGAIVAITVIVLVAGGIWYFSWRQERSWNRAVLIASTYDRATHQGGKTPTQRRYEQTQRPVEKPPALTAPPPEVEPDTPAFEHHVAEGIAAAQFMLDKLWTQKGYGRP